MELNIEAVRFHSERTTQYNTTERETKRTARAPGLCVISTIYSASVNYKN